MTDNAEQQEADASPDRRARAESPPESVPHKPNRRRQGGDGLGSLVGGGSSQVGTNGAMRARDVSRPR